MGYGKKFGHCFSKCFGDDPTYQNVSCVSKDDAPAVSGIHKGVGVLIMGDVSNVTLNSWGVRGETFWGLNFFITKGTQ